MHVTHRWDLEYWRTTRTKRAAEDGEWVLRWRNRGKPIKHTVTVSDADTYATVPMHHVAALESVHVLNCYGVLGSQEGSQASYDTGPAMLTDGVVPYADVEGPANAVRHHTLRFLPGVGHFFREEGSSQKLWLVLRDWLLSDLPSGGSAGRAAPSRL